MSLEVDLSNGLDGERSAAFERYKLLAYRPYGGIDPIGLALGIVKLNFYFLLVQVA